MSIIRGKYDSDIGRHDGEKAVALQPRIVRYTANDLRRIRAGEMVVKRESGWHMADIARHYRISQQLAYYDIGDVPDHVRSMIIREHLRASNSVG